MARRIDGKLAAVGPILIAISVIHLAVTPLFHGPAVAAIVSGGVLNAVESGATALDARAAAFWYVTAGLGLALLGYLAWWVERRIGTLPAALGWLLLGFTIVTVLLVPVSPFWIFLLPAAIVLWRARHPDSTRVSAYVAGAP